MKVKEMGVQSDAGSARCSRAGCLTPAAVINTTQNNTAAACAASVSPCSRAAVKAPPSQQHVSASTTSCCVQVCSLSLQLRPPPPVNDQLHVKCSCVIVSSAPRSPRQLQPAALLLLRRPESARGAHSIHAVCTVSQSVTSVTAGSCELPCVCCILVTGVCSEHRTCPVLL